MSRGTVGLLKQVLPRTAFWQMVLGVLSTLAHTPFATAAIEGGDLGTFRSSVPIVKSDSLSSTNAEDIWTIAFTEKASGTIQLTGLAADLDIELRSATGVLGSSDNGGTQDEAIPFTVDGGAFSIRVLRYGDAQSAYTLKLNFTVAASNDTSATALNLGSFAPRTTRYTVTHKNLVGTGDQVDYLRVTFTGNATGKVTLSGLNADLDLSFDSKTAPLRSLESESISFSVQSGTYLIKVAPYKLSQSPYVLSLSVAVTPEPEFELGANPTKTQINTLGTAATGFVHWYKFNTTSFPASTGLGRYSRGFTLVLSKMTRDLDIALYDSNKTEPPLVRSINSGTYDERIHCYSSAQTTAGPYPVGSLPTGTYYLRVFRKSPVGSSSYQLDVSTQGP